MVFAVYDQGMRIQTPRKTLLARRGVEALQQTHRARRISDTSSDSSHLERMAEQPFEQMKVSLPQREPNESSEGSSSGAQPEQQKPTDTQKLAEESDNIPPELRRRAVKAYSSAQASGLLNRPRVNAALIMSRPIISADFDQNLQEGWQMMQRHQVRHLVLINRKGQLMGLVSDKDILKVSSGVGAIDLGQRELSEVMLIDLVTRQLLTVTPDTELSDIARAMLEQKVSALPVVTEQDELKGIITRTDLLQAMVTGHLEAWY